MSLLIIRLIIWIQCLSELSRHISMGSVTISTHCLEELFGHDDLGVTCPANAFVILRSSWVYGYHLIKALCLWEFFIELFNLLILSRLLVIIMLGLAWWSIANSRIWASSAWQYRSFNLLIRVGSACCHSRCVWWLDESFWIGVMSTWVCRWDVVLKCRNYFLVVSDLLLKSLNVFIILSF
jgi:hypothetical protein